MGLDPSTGRPKGRLEGRIAAVTGASQGLGAVISRRLVEEGASVVLMARTADRLTSLATELGPSSMALRCDVADPTSVAEAFQQVSERWGRLDILINNAAIRCVTTLESHTDQAINDQVATNLIGPMLCSRAALPLVRSAGGGHIINISSRSVELARPFLSVYSATKGGLETFTRTLAAEVRPSGVKVSAIRVGPVAAEPRTESGDTETHNVTQEWVTRGGPAPDDPAPAESVADAVLFITTARAGARIPVLHVDPE
jgi:NAD(P)-dependent dehydrogenase (short-subunit alcohol dehydrogenase family)